MDLLQALALHTQDEAVSAPMRALEKTCGLPYQLSHLLQRSHPALTKLADEGENAEGTDAEANNMTSNYDARPSPAAHLMPLDPTTPYIGFWRHAPPSDEISFIRQTTAQDQMPEFTLECPAMDDSGELLGSVPGEVWELVLSWALEMPTLGSFLAVSRAFHELPRSHVVWQGRTLRIAPQALRRFVPQLHAWLPHWKSVARLVVPRSSQLAAEMARHSPTIPVEVAWRFARHLRGRSVEVLDCGRVVRRVGDEGLVVLGDAPLVRPFFEVRLDKRAQEGLQSDNLNDFGIGVTICDPKDIDEDLGDVADDVPQSWVVDFARSFTVLSVRNCEAAKSFELCAQDLAGGDRVGLRMLPEGIEVFVNGALRATLTPPAEDRIPVGTAFYPVLDLYGQALQISLSDAEGPEP